MSTNQINNHLEHNDPVFVIVRDKIDDTTEKAVDDLCGKFSEFTSPLFFDDLAGQISNCVETREEGGEIGWVNVDGHSNEDAVVDDVGVVGVVGVVAGGGENSDSNEYLDLILPKNARDEVFTMSSKVRHSFSRYCVYFIDLIVQQLPYSFLFSLGIL